MRVLIKITCFFFIIINVANADNNTKWDSPSPRAPINQGIDISNPLVLEHDSIYDNLLSQIEEENNIENFLIFINPFSTAPSSAYIGIYIEQNDPALNDEITIKISETGDENSITIYKTANFKEPGEYLIPISGLIPNSKNDITIETSTLSVKKELTTAPLPPSDSESISEGFIIPSLKYKTSDLSSLSDGLYFVTHWNRNNIAFDNNGKIRWYTTSSIPSYNLERLSNGNFIATEDATNNFLDMYEFDIVGRIHAIYHLDNRIHHSIKAIPNNKIIVPSEWSQGRDYSGNPQTMEDGISIIDLSTGQETAYYDLFDELDPSRTPQPTDELATTYDWLHINQAYITNDGLGNIIVFSGRHQNAIVAINQVNGEKIFIFGSHENWSEEYQEYLLNPIDSEGNYLYDFTSDTDKELANKEFWTWGQHSVVETNYINDNIFEFYVFDNGNYRSYEDDLSLLPTENWSRVVHFKVNVENKTVEKIWEYGKNEVGNRGYTSYVGSVTPLSNGNILVNFGSVVEDDSGNILTAFPGYSDIPGNEDGTANGKPFIQEINPINNELLFELEFTSGYTKTYENNGSYYRMDVSGFRAYKWPMYIN